MTLFAVILLSINLQIVHSGHWCCSEVFGWDQSANYQFIFTKTDYQGGNRLKTLYGMWSTCNKNGCIAMS